MLVGFIFSSFIRQSAAVVYDIQQMKLSAISTCL